MNCKQSDTPRLTGQWTGWIAALLAVTLALVLIASVSAQEPTPRPAITDNQVNAIAKQMYCPVCENTPLDVCPTQACIEWRELIRDLLAEGKSEVEIKQYFVNRFGDRVLAAPPARGLNWLIYVIPPVAILAGLLILFSALRSWRQNNPAATEPASGASRAIANEDEKYSQRLEEELRKL